MKKLPLTIILLILFLAVFFNFERILPGDMGLPAIGSFVYVLSTIAIVFTILLRMFTKMQPVYMTVMWSLFYLFLKLAVFTGTPFWGQNFGFVTLIEIGFLLVGVTLAHAVGSQLQDFHHAVEKITFAHSPESRKFSDEIENINSEIYRSRRYNHPLTMILFQPVRDSQEMFLNNAVQEVYQSLTSRFVAISVAKVLRENIRRSDHLLEQPEKGRYIVLTPETDKEQAVRVIEKIREAAHSLDTDVTVGVSSFPEDALNLEDLLKEVEVDLKRNQAMRIDAAQNDVNAVLNEK